MMAAYAASVPAGAGPNGPDGKRVADGLHGGDTGSVVDPIFDAPEPVDRPTKRATLLFQFFLFPLLIVVASVGVFLFFGTLGGSDRSPEEYLKGVVGGGENEQKQDAQQLAVLLAKEREKVDAGTIPLAKAFYAKKEFRDQLVQAFEGSLVDRTLDRQVFLASALGLVGSPDFLPTLSAHVGPSAPADLRLASVNAVGELQTEDAAGVLAPLVKDAQEPVRNLAVLGLSRHKTPAGMAALREALGDESALVQANAAAALAVLGEDPGRDLLDRLLDPAWVESIVTAQTAPRKPGEDPPVDVSVEMRRAALANAIRGAYTLKAERLRPRVLALTNDKDSEVRHLAADVLERWPAPKK